MPTEISAILGLSGSRPDLRAGEGIATSPAADVRQELPLANSRARTAPDTDTSLKDINQVVEELNNKVQNIRRELHFAVDDESGYTIITVVDTESEEVIRQIPSEEVVALSRHLEQHAGLLMDAEV